MRLGEHPTCLGRLCSLTGPGTRGPHLNTRGADPAEALRPACPPDYTLALRRAPDDVPLLAPGALTLLPSGLGPPPPPPPPSLHPFGPFPPPPPTATSHNNTLPHPHSTTRV